MNIRNMRVILVAAIVAALLGGGVATAKSLISGKDIRNSSITGADIKNSSLTGADIKSKSVSISDLTKATQNLIRSGGASSTSGKPGANGSNGANGATGATGATGPAGPAGPKGDKGDSGDPTPGVITGANWTVKGFGRWRDSDSASTITFDTGVVKLAAPASTTAGTRVGLNFPLQQGTRVVDISVLKYIGNAGLALEVDPSGDASTAPNYSTFVYVPAETGATVTHDTLTDAHWGTTTDIGTIKSFTKSGGTADHKLSDLLAAANPSGTGVDDQARVLFARVGNGSSTGGAAVDNSVAGIQTQIKGSPLNTYAFTK